MPHYSNLYYLYSSNHASSIEIVRKIHEMQEKRRRLNTDVNLPPNLITRKIHEYVSVDEDEYKNLITVEILRSYSGALMRLITLNSIKKILKRYGFNGKIKREVLSES